MIKTPEQMRAELLNSLDRPIMRALDSEGITDELLAQKLREELEAYETKTFQYQGTIIRSDPQIAWDIRQRARQDAHKLRGDYPAEKKSLTFQDNQEERELTPEEQDKVTRIEAILSEGI